MADYVTDAEVSDTADQLGLSWTGDQADRDSARARAQLWIDGRSWQGQKFGGRSQEDQWPRSFVTDRDGFSIDSQEIPHEIKTATALLAIVELDTPNALSPEVTPGQITKSESVGPISVEYFKPGGVASARPVITRAMDALKPLMRRNPHMLTRA